MLFRIVLAMGLVITAGGQAQAQTRQDVSSWFNPGQPAGDLPLSGSGTKRPQDYADDVARATGNTPTGHMGKPATTIGPIILVSGAAHQHYRLWGNDCE